MGNLMIKLFIKSNDFQNNETRKKVGYLCAGYGLGTNLLLMLMKVLIGFIFNQIALIADGINNLSDTLSSLVCLLGFKLSQKPADRKHPYGHQKIDYLASIFIGLIILILGSITLYTSGKGIYDFFTAEQIIWKVTKPSISSTIITLVVLIVSIVVKISQVYLYFFFAKKINSLSLKATGEDSRNDVILTSSILVGYIITLITLFSLDDYLGILVSILVIYSGINIIIQAGNKIIGLHPDEDLINKIKEILKEDKEVISFHDLMLHNNGADKYSGSLHVELRSTLSFVEAHEVADRLEKSFIKELNTDITIHLDPVFVDDDELNIYRENIEKCLETISNKLNLHDIRLIKKSDEKILRFDIFYPLAKEDLTKEELKKFKKLGANKYQKEYEESITEQIRNCINNCGDNCPLDQIKLEITFDKDSYDLLV